MKKIALTVLAVAGLVFSLNGVAKEHLGDRHGGLGIECADCHQTDKPTKRAKSKTCKACHGDKVALPIFQAEERSVDFHESPHGKVRCTKCHLAHQEPVMYCNECHAFDKQLP
ncbi:cytochrome c3 family protein [Ferrimonas futtsuensis]|uniref:cytochrome c3 family protein n=1 Tax=Ferrimonas futtsuensis TaxID=364764 RepID=UPI00042A5196|nr:cytochrome c3 family protein [Ferrimonas futtsuensis]